MSAFAERYWGHFGACLRWTDAEALAGRVAAQPGPWYWAEPENDGVPVHTLDADAAAARFREHVAEMQRLKKGAYCNLIFADNSEEPGLIKLFHPRRSGDACRVGGDPIPPWGVLSRYPVDTAVFGTGGETEGESPRLWRRLLRIGS